MAFNGALKILFISLLFAVACEGKCNKKCQRNKRKSTTTTTSTTTTAPEGVDGRTGQCVLEEIDNPCQYSGQMLRYVSHTAGVAGCFIEYCWCVDGEIKPVMLPLDCCCRRTIAVDRAETMLQKILDTLGTMGGFTRPLEGSMPDMSSLFGGMIGGESEGTDVESILKILCSTLDEGSDGLGSLLGGLTGSGNTGDFESILKLLCDKPGAGSGGLGDLFGGIPGGGNQGTGGLSSLLGMLGNGGVPGPNGLANIFGSSGGEDPTNIAGIVQCLQNIEEGTENMAAAYACFGFEGDAGVSGGLEGLLGGPGSGQESSNSPLAEAFAKCLEDSSINVDGSFDPTEGSLPEGFLDCLMTALQGQSNGVGNFLLNLGNGMGGGGEGPGDMSGLLGMMGGGGDGPGNMAGILGTMGNEGGPGGMGGFLGGMGGEGGPGGLVGILGRFDNLTDIQDCLKEIRDNTGPGGLDSESIDDILECFGIEGGVESILGEAGNNPLTVYIKQNLDLQGDETSDEIAEAIFEILGFAVSARVAYPPGSAK